MWETGTCIHCWWEWKWCSHCGRQFDDSLTSKHRITDPAILFLDMFPTELKTGVQTKTVCSVYSSIIHSGQKVETTQMSIDRWMDKPIVVYPDNGLLLSIMKYWFMLQCRWTSKTWTKWKKTHAKATHIWWFHLYEIFRIGKPIETESKLVVAWDWGQKGKWEMTV